MKFLLVFSIPLIIACPDTTRAQGAPASFAYILQADAFASTKEKAVAKLAACDRDWIVLDAAFARDALWTREDLKIIRAGRADRQVIAYLSIGEAEDYRPYWRSEWVEKGKLTADAPTWLLAENPDWPGNFRVRYWRPEWQSLILAAVDDAMTRGFDGVYLDIVDGFETFEQQGDDFLDDRLNPETKQTYRRDMVDWVQAVAARARRTNPRALVIPQNGSQLLARQDYLAAISAIGIEDLFTEGDKQQPQSHIREVLADLQPLAAANKPVLLIEYPRKHDRQVRVAAQARAHHLVLLLADRQLKTLGTSGVAP